MNQGKKSQGELNNSEDFFQDKGIDADFQKMILNNSAKKQYIHNITLQHQEQSYQQNISIEDFQEKQNFTEPALLNKEYSQMEPQKQETEQQKDPLALPPSQNLQTHFYKNGFMIESYEKYIFLMKQKYPRRTWYNDNSSLRLQGYTHNLLESANTQNSKKDPEKNKINIFFKKYISELQLFEYKNRKKLKIMILNELQKCGEDLEKNNENILNRLNQSQINKQLSSKIYPYLYSLLFEIELVQELKSLYRPEEYEQVLQIKPPPNIKQKISIKDIDAIIIKIRDKYGIEKGIMGQIFGTSPEKEKFFKFQFLAKILIRYVCLSDSPQQSENNNIYQQYISQDFLNTLNPDNIDVYSDKKLYDIFKNVLKFKGIGDELLTQIQFCKTEFYQFWREKNQFCYEEWIVQKAKFKSPKINEIILKNEKTDYVQLKNLYFNLLEETCPTLFNIIPNNDSANTHHRIFLNLHILHLSNKNIIQKQQQQLELQKTYDPINLRQ